MEKYPIQRIGNSQEAEKWLSMSEAALHTPYSAEYLSLLARKGKLSAKKVDNAWYTTKPVLEAYMQKQMLREQIQNGQLPSTKVESVALSTAPVEPLKPVRSYKDDLSDHTKSLESVKPTAAPTHHPLELEHTLEKVIDRKFFSHKPRVKRFVPSGSTLRSVFMNKTIAALAVVSIIFFTLMPVPFVFSFVESGIERALEAIGDARTVMGFRPGTHANELLLLDKHGNIAITGRIESHVEDGVAPIVVDSRTMVENLNAEFLGGASSSDFTLAFVTANGAVTTEDVTLSGNVEVGETLLVRGAAKLLSALEVDGVLGTLDEDGFTKILKVISPAEFQAAVEMMNHLKVHGSIDVGGSVVIGRGLQADIGYFNSLGVGGDFSASGDVNLGHSTSTTLYTGRLRAAVATLTDLISDNVSVGALTSTNSTSTNATSTNLYAENASFANLDADNINFTNLSFELATGTAATTTNLYAEIFNSQLAIFNEASSTNLQFTNATGTNATTTNFFATNLSGTNATFENLTGTTIDLTNLIFGYATGTAATTTNFFSTIGTFDSLYVNDYQQNDGTFVINSSAVTGDVFSVTDNLITDGTLIQQTLTANAGNGQTSRGQVIDLVDATTAGGGYSALAINISGSGTGSGDKLLLDLNPGGSNRVVFDDDGAFRPTTDADTNTNSLGSASFYWNSAFIDTITANSVAGTITGGDTSSNTWTIGSTEAGDTNKALIFQRNSGSGNATLEWNKGSGDERYLSVNYPFNATYTVNDSSIGTTVDLYSGLLTNNTTSGTQTLLSLVNTGTGTTETGVYINNTGTGTTGLEIAGTWTNGIVTNNNSVNIGTGGLIFGTATGTSATTTNSFTTTASSTNLFSTNFNLGAGLIGRSTTTNATTTTLFSTTASSTSLFSTSANIGSITAGLINPGFTTGSVIFQNASGLAQDNSNFFWDDSNNRLGIGTTTPDELLSLYGGTANTQLSIDANANRQAAVTFRSAGTDQWYIGRGDSDNLSESTFFIGENEGNATDAGGNSARFVIDSAGEVGIGDTTPDGKLDIAGVNSNGLFGVGAFSQQIANSTTALRFGTDSTNSYAWIQAANPGVTDNRNLVLNPSAGNVGIGDTTPDALLDVAGTLIVEGATSDFGVADTTGHVAVIHGSATGSNEGGEVQLRFAADHDSSTEGFFLDAYQDDFRIFNGGNVRMQIQGDTGNVGIGTTTPSQKLEVNGTIMSANTNGFGQLRLVDWDDVSYRATLNNDGTLLFQQSSNAFSTASTIMTLDGSNVGIGTTSPWGLLSVTNTGSGPSFVVEDSTSPDSTPFLIDASGNVGIGEASPDTRLHITSADANIFKLERTDGNNVPIQFTNTTASVYAGLSSGANFAIGTGQDLASTAQLTVQRTTGNVGIGTNDPQERLHLSGGVALFNAATVGTGADPDGGIRIVAPIASSEYNWLIGAEQNVSGAFELTPSTAVGGTTFSTPAFVIEAATGDIGLGTNDPEVNLHVKSSDSTLEVESTGASVDAQIALGTDDDRDWIIKSEADDDSLRFRTQDGTATDILTILQGGNVGIGTTTPGGILDIHAANPLPRITHSNTANYGALYFYENLTRRAGFQTIGSTFATTDRRNDLEIFSDAGDVTFYTNSNFSAPKAIITSGGNVGIGTTTPDTTLNVYNGNESATLTNFTQAVTNAGVLITTDYTDDTYTPGIFWSTQNNNGTKPMAGIWSFKDGQAGSKLFFGTSNVFATGITNTGLVLDQSGNVGIGTTTPIGQLSIRGTVGGGVSGLGALTTGDNIVLESGGEARFYFLNDGNNPQGIHWGNPTAINDGRLLYSNGSREMQFYTANTQAAVIDSSQDFGIGTTSPWGKLSVTNTGTGPSFVVEDSASPDSTPFLIDASGNVGIGTASPGEELHIYQASNESDLKVESDGSHSVLKLDAAASNDPKIFFQEAGTTVWNIGVDTSDSDKLMFGTNEAVPTSPLVTFTTGGNVGIGTTTPNQLLTLSSSASPTINISNSDSTLSTDEEVGSILFNANDGSTNGVGLAGAIKSLTTSTGNGVNNALAFFSRCGSGCSDQSATALERMRIDYNGNVGIGTTTPSAKLQVYGGNTYLGSASGHNVVLNPEGAVGDTNYINFTNTRSFVGYDGSVSALRLQSGSGKPIIFAVDNATFGSGEVGRIDTAGDFGIGTTSPWGKLSVTNTGSGPSFVVEDSTSPDSTPFIIDAAGNVGIGTASMDAQSLLHVRGNVLAEANANTSGAVRNKGFHLWTDEAYGIELHNDGADWATALFARQDSDIRLGHYAGNATAQNTLSTKFVVKPSGRVGIGTTTPDTLLHTWSNGDNDLTVEADADNSGENDNPRVVLRQDGNLINGIFGANGDAGTMYTGALANAIFIEAQDVNNANAIQFVTGGDVASSPTVGTARLTIEPGGDIGIGATNPVTYLHVDGAAAATNSFNAQPTLLVDGSIGIEGSSNPKIMLGDDAQTNDPQFEWQFVSGTPHRFRVNYVDDTITSADLFAIQSGGNVGIGDSTPDTKLEIVDTTAQLRLTHTDGVDDTTFAVDTNGDMTINLNATTGQGNLLLSDTDTFAIGGVAAGLAYNAISDSGGSSSSGLASDDDLYIEGDLEVDGTIYGATYDTTFTLGSVVFAGTNGVLTQDNSNFFWDDTNNRLGIGRTPTSKLDINDGTDISPDNTAAGQVRVTGNGYSAFLALDASAMSFGHNSSSRRLDFMTNETTRLSITGSGDVGIGTTSPDALFDVTTGTAGINGRVLLDPTNNNRTLTLSGSTGVATIDSTITNTGGAGNLVLNPSGGNVGIASSTPSSLLSIGSGGSSSELVEFTDTSGQTSVDFQSAGTGAPTTAAGWKLRLWGSGTYAADDYGLGIESNTIWMNTAGTNINFYDSGTEVGTFENGYFGVGTTTPWAKVSITNTGTDPSFVVEDTTSPDTSPFTIDANGQVGILTTSPGAPLQVWSSTDVTSTGGGSVRIGASDAAMIAIDDNEIQAFNSGAASSGALHINNDGGSVFVHENVDGVFAVNTDDLYVEADADIGIGTASPVYELHVHDSGTDGEIMLTNSNTGSTGNDGFGLSLDANGFGRLTHKDSSFALLASNTEVMRIISNSVGIFDTTPDATLEVVNDGSGDSFLVADTNDGDTTPFIIEADGQVGIGTSTPRSGYKVDIRGGDLAFDGGELIFQDAGGTTNNIEYIHLNDAGLTGINPRAVFGFFGDNALGGTVSAPTAGIAVDGIYSADVIGVGTTTPSGGLEIFGMESGSAQLVLDATTAAVPQLLLKDGNKDIAVPDGQTLQIGEWNDSTDTFTENMTILSSGNVGIGTTAPDALLHVSGGNILLDNTQRVQWENSSGTAIDVLRLDSANIFSFTSAAQGYDFENTSNTTLVRILESGEVGIGIASPAAKLDVDTGSNANGEGLRLRGTAETVEIADFYVGSLGQLVISTALTGDTQAHIEVDSEDDNYGFIIRDSNTGSTDWANLYLTNDTTDYLNIVVNAANSTAGLVVDDDNQVGIGVTDPDTGLTIAATSQVASMTSNQINLRSSRAAIAAGEFIGGIGFVSNDTSYTAPGTTTAAIMAIAGGAHTATQAATDLAFYTSNGVATSTEKMRILDNGNVGIGTGSPTSALTVIGSVDTSVQFLGQAADTVSAPSFSWTGDTNVGMYRPTTDVIGFTAAGAEVARIQAGALDVTAGGVISDARIKIEGSGAGCATTEDDGSAGIWYSDAGDCGTVFAGINTDTNGSEVWGVYLGGWEALFSRTAFYPSASGGLDLGGSSNYFADLYLNGGNINTGAALTIGDGGDNITINGGGTFIVDDAALSFNTATNDYSQITNDAYHISITPMADLAIAFDGNNNSTGDFLLIGHNASDPDAANWEELARMQEDGYFGLGETTPNARLHVGSSTPGSIAAGEAYRSAFISGDLEVDGTIYGSVAGTITPGGFTEGSVVFATSTGALDQDNSGLFFDSATNELGIGTAAPSAALDVIGSAEISGALTLGTDLAVANGGTGASTLTNGGILLGSGTGAITAMAVLSNGQIVVGDGTTDPVALTAFTSSTGTLIHERGGMEADVSAYGSGLYGMVSSVTTDIDTCAEFASIAVWETGTCGSIVLSASPTLTGTITAAAADFSGNVTVSGALSGRGTASESVVGENRTDIGDGRIVMESTSTTSNAAIWEIDNAGGIMRFFNPVDEAMYLTNVASNGRLQIFGGSPIDLNTGGDSYFMGNLGIGDSTPSFTLDVTGTANITSTLAVGSTITEAGSNVLSVADLDTCAEFAALGALETGTCGSVVLSASPTLTGTLTAAAANFSGAVSANSLTLTTDLAVANGGTGASTLTNGGILLGSGTGAITAMAVLTNGQIVVGDGTTDPVALTAFTSSTGDLIHEAGGLEADVSGYTNGLYGMLSGVTADIDTESELETALGGLDVITVTASDITSANLATALSDETGTGSVVFSASPTLTGTLTAAAATFSGTLTANSNIAANGSIVLGDNGDNITINSNVWDITAAGAVSGVTTISASGLISTTANNTKYFQGGDDAALYDINVANTVGIYGEQNSAIGCVYFGSGGAHVCNSGTALTIGGNTVWHTANDGTGTGLDADYLDGISSGSFLQSGASITVADINTGQGATEVYAMNQNVRTDSDVTFINLTVSSCSGCGGVDVAENFVVTESVEAGDVVAIAPTAEAPAESEGFALRKATSTASSMGIVATTPGLLLDNGTAILGARQLSGTYSAGEEAPVALAGRVPVKFSLENGEIEAGDYLTVSTDEPGKAAKATGAGMVIGQALTSSEESEDGKVLVYVTHFYWAGNELEGLNTRLAAIELNMASSSMALEVSTSTPGFVAGVLESMKAAMVDGVVHFVKLAVESLTAKALTVGDNENPTGITIYDEATGEPYCFKIRYGSERVKEGVCGAEEEEVLSSNDQPSTSNESPSSDTQTETPLESASSTPSSSDSNGASATTTEPVIEDEPVAEEPTASSSPETEITEVEEGTETTEVADETETTDTATEPEPEPVASETTTEETDNI